MKTNKELAIELINLGVKNVNAFPMVDLLVAKEAIEIAAKPPDLSDMYNQLISDKLLYATWYEARHKKEIEIAFMERLAQQNIISLTPDKL